MTREQLDRSVRRHVRASEIIIWAIWLLLAGLTVLVVWATIDYIGTANECKDHGGVMLRYACVDKRVVIPLP